MTNTLAVVRQDLLDARRSYLVWGVAGIFVLLTALLFWAVGGTSDPSTALALDATAYLGILLVPLVALVASYLAIAGERESGTIRFLLGYPTTRAEVVVGKLLSRLAVVDGAIVAAILVSLGIAVLRFPSVDLPLVVGFTALTLLYTSAYVAIAIGISASVASRSRAMIGAVGAYFLFNVTWSVFLPVNVPDFLAWALDKVGVALSPEAYNFVWLLSPPRAYLNAVALASPDLGQGVGLDAPYLSPAASAVVLVGWIVAPVALGYLRFRSADIS